MKKSTIMAMAAVAALAVPSVASADIEGQFVDIAAPAIEGVALTSILPPVVCPNFNPEGNCAIIDNGPGEVLDSRLRLRWDQNDPNAVARLEEKARELRVQDPNDPGEQSAIPAPDGTPVRTDVYTLELIQAFIGPSPFTLLFSDGKLAPLFLGTVTDGAGNPILEKTQDQQFELKVRPPDDGSIVPFDHAACNVVVLVNNDDGTAMAASQPDDQAAC